MSRFGYYTSEFAALGLAGWLRFRWAKMLLAIKKEGTLVRFPTRLGSVWVRVGSSDYNTYWDIFVRREYKCMDSVESPQFIVDCGANVGYSAVYFLEKYAGARLLAVEPDSENAVILKRNVARFDSRVSVIEGAVWSRSAGLVISNPDASAWAFQIREALPGEKASIEAFDISSLLRSAGRDFIDILKIDIEGAEKEIFRDCPWLDRVANLVIELHGPDCEQAVVQAVAGRARPVRSGEVTVFNFAATQASQDH